MNALKLASTTTATFTIDKGVPLPRGRYGGTRTTKYPFPLMDVGDSFALPDNEKERMKIRSASVAWGRTNKKKLSTLRMEDGTYRCFRIA